MFEESVRLAVTAPVSRLAFRITDYSFWKYGQHKKIFLSGKTVQIILCSQIVNVNNVSKHCMTTRNVLPICILVFTSPQVTPKSKQSLLHVTAD